MISRAIAARASAIPDVPTVAEAGYTALTMDGLVGLFGPPTLPKDLRERIAADIRTVMDADPLINDRLIMTAQVPNPGGPGEFAKSARAGRRWPSFDGLDPQARIGSRSSGCSSLARRQVAPPAVRVGWSWLPTPSASGVDEAIVLAGPDDE